MFSPFSVPGYLLPFWDSLAVAAMLKLFFAAFGAYVLGRMLGMRFGGALAAGLVYAFGTFFIVWLAWPLTSIFALVPWLLVLAELLVRRPGPLPAAGLAALVALQFFGGHPESSFHAMFALVVFFAFRLASTRASGGRADPCRAAPGASCSRGALATGAAIAAVALVPFLELLFGSGDLDRRLDIEAGHWPAQVPRRAVPARLLGPADERLDDRAVHGRSAAGTPGRRRSCSRPPRSLLRPTRDRVAVAVFALFCGLMVRRRRPGLLARHEAARLQRRAQPAPADLRPARARAARGLGPRRAERREAAAACGGDGSCWRSAPCSRACRSPGWRWPGRSRLGQLGRGLEVAWGFADPPPVDRLDPGNAAADAVRMSALLQWLPLAGLALALIAWRLRGGAADPGRGLRRR